MQSHRHTHVTKFETIVSLTLTVDQISADFVQDLFVQPQAVNGIPQNCPVGQVLRPICVLLQCKQKSSKLSSILQLKTKCYNSKSTCVAKSIKHMVDKQEFKDMYRNELWKYFHIHLRVKARLMKPWNCIARGSSTLFKSLYKHTHGSLDTRKLSGWDKSGRSRESPGESPKVPFRLSCRPPAPTTLLCCYCPPHPPSLRVSLTPNYS